MSFLKKIKENEYLDFQNVKNELMMFSEHLPNQVSNEIFKQHGQKMLKEIEFFDSRNCIRLPRSHFSNVVVEYASCYSIFFHLFQFEGIGKKVCLIEFF